MLKALQKRTKARGLVGGVDIERARQHRRLIRDHADGPARERARIRPPYSRANSRVHLQEIGAVHDARDHVADVVADLGVLRHDLVQLRIVECLVIRLRRAEGPRGCAGAGRKAGAGRSAPPRRRFRRRNATTPDLFIWARAPPRSSAVTTSPVTWRITAGPVMNIRPSRVWMMKSVSAGLYAAPPAHGPANQRDLRHDAR